MSITKRPHIVVIGGGATGTGIAREASQRGFRVTLIERKQLGDGTSGHFHGMLHSGARYVVNSPEVARECYEENQRLRGLIPSAITNTGGMFVALTANEAAHADIIMSSCRAVGIPAIEISKNEALQSEPQLTKHVQRAFRVPDAFIDGVELIRLSREAALSAKIPAVFMERHVVESFDMHQKSITNVIVRDVDTGEREHIACDYVVNAAGVWAGKVAGLAKVPFDMVYDKGTMMVFEQQFSHAVLNRCRPEGDGDLLVPSAEGSIMGTTARVVDSPDNHTPTQEEVDALLREGAAMIPKLAGASVRRLYAGVRPLFSPSDAVAISNTRSIDRSYRVIDHEQEGRANFISIVGGKVTLYRRMAEAVVNALEAKALR